MEIRETLGTPKIASGNLDVPTTGPDTMNVGNLPIITRFQKGQFFERFNAMIAATDEYAGTLPAAIESAEEVLPADPFDQAAEEPSNETDHRHEIDTLRGRLHNARITSAVIEAAHLYMYQDIDDEGVRQSVLAQCQYAAELSAQLEGDGIDVRQILFIDDYNPDPVTGELEDRLDIPDFIETVRDVGYDPSMIMREASMVPLAKQILEIMDGQGVTKIAEARSEQDSGAEDDATDQESIQLAYRNYELYRPEEDKVSCAMLDTALTIVKLRHLGEAVINVLPRRHESQPFSYKGQQRKMRHILGMHLGVRIMPIFNLFTGDKLADPISAGSHHALRKSH